MGIALLIVIVWVVKLVLIILVLVLLVRNFVTGLASIIPLAVQIQTALVGKLVQVIPALVLVVKY